MTQSNELENELTSCLDAQHSSVYGEPQETQYWGDGPKLCGENQHSYLESSHFNIGIGVYEGCMGHAVTVLFWTSNPRLPFLNRMVTLQ